MSDSEVVLYGLPNCDQVRKARAWLDDHGMIHRFHDLKKSGADVRLITEWQEAVDWKQLLNRKSTTWRGLCDGERAAVTDAASAAALMSLHPALIKRPVLRFAERIHVGFSNVDYQFLFKV